MLTNRERMISPLLSGSMFAYLNYLAIVNVYVNVNTFSNFMTPLPLYEESSI